MTPPKLPVQVPWDDPTFYMSLFTALDSNTVLRAKNADGVFIPVSCSREFAEMMECTPEEFIAMETENPLCTVYPEDRADVAFFLENGRAKDGTNHVVTRKNTLKGNLIWVDLHYAFFESHGVRYAYCSYFDITQVKQNELRAQALYEDLNQQLHSITDNNLSSIRASLTDGIVEEIDGRDLYPGDAVGARIEDLINVRLQNIPNPADRMRYLKHFSIEGLIEKYSRGEDVEPLVLFCHRASGKQCFVRFSVLLRKDPVTGLPAVFGTEEEYNAQKVDEVLRRQILARQFDMICYLVDGMYGVVIGDAANIRHGSIFPREKNGVYADYIRQQVIPHVHGGAGVREAMLRALSAEVIGQRLAESDFYTVDVTCEIDGELYYKRLSFYAVDRDARFYILLKTDYTEVQREQVLRNEQLGRALEEARQANVAKTVFLSNMSHEIRTPMNAIIGLDNIALSEKDLPAKTRTQLEQIGSSARHLLTLINDILDMSRIESGRMVLKNDEFSLRTMIGQINTMIGGQCQDRGLQYDCRVHGRVNDYYVGDETKLKQVLLNILGNAVKFTPAPGSVLFSVEQLSDIQNKTTLRFVVRDTGIGMDKEYLPRLFEVFSQEDSGNTSQYGGSGLGMAITRTLVEMMNGSISVTSEKGKGSEFTVDITLSNSEHACAREKTVLPEDLDVLVIDDDPIACEHARLVLAEAGGRVETALSGREALAMIRERLCKNCLYSLILVDLRMPEQDGIEVVRRIRGLIGSETTVIMLTAYNWDDVEEDARQAGVDAFLSKPLFSEAATEEFSRVLQRKEAAAREDAVRTSLSGRRILLAEDMEINAEIMKQLLQMREIRVDLAVNGQIAVDMFRDSAPGYYDAILMDVRMPVMDGITATRTIRALPNPDSRTVPIIAMTANAFDEDVQRSLQAGMNAHLSKPVEPERLFDTLAGLIGN